MLDDDDGNDDSFDDEADKCRHFQHIGIFDGDTQTTRVKSFLPRELC